MDPAIANATNLLATLLILIFVAPFCFIISHYFFRFDNTKIDNIRGTASYVPPSDVRTPLPVFRVQVRRRCP